MFHLSLSSVLLRHPLYRTWIFSSRFWATLVFQLPIVFERSMSLLLGCFLLFWVFLLLSYLSSFQQPIFPFCPDHPAGDTDLVLLSDVPAGMCFYYLYSWLVSAVFFFSSNSGICTSFSSMLHLKSGLATSTRSQDEKLWPGSHAYWILCSSYYGYESSKAIIYAWLVQDHYTTVDTDVWARLLVINVTSM